MHMVQGKDSQIQINNKAIIEFGSGSTYEESLRPLFVLSASTFSLGN